MLQSPQLVESLIESAQFRMLLFEQVREIVEGMNQDKKVATITAPSIVQEIGLYMESIIGYKVKNSFNEEYTGYLQQNYDMRKDIEDVKVQIQKIQHQRHTVQTMQSINRRDNLPEGPAPQKDRRTADNNMEVTKLRQDMETMKQSLQKVSNNKILEFVSETSLQLSKKIEDKYNKLQHQIHQMSCRNADTSLDKTTGDMIDLKYETLERKLEAIYAAQREMIERFKALETGVMQKYETNFTSVWNVITNMESTFRASLSSLAAKKEPERELENLRSFVSPSARLAKKINFTNLFNFN